ncbi:hypothetical protein LNK82_41795 [Saccharothrix sp. NEAU-S10]|nr:hypothetical protein [Saccharothrix luteola]
MVAPTGAPSRSRLSSPRPPGDTHREPPPYHLVTRPRGRPRNSDPSWRDRGLHPGTGRAGVSVRSDEAHQYDLEVADGHVAVIARIGPLRQRVAERPVPPGPVTLVITTRADGADVRPGAPDLVGSQVGGEPEPLAELDGRHLSAEVSTGFTGRVIGMCVTGGTACFDWFDYEAADVLPRPR